MLARVSSALRVLTYLNWLIAIPFILLAAASLTEPVQTALTSSLGRKLGDGSTAALIDYIRYMGLLTIPVAWAAHCIFVAVRAIIASASACNPFDPANAARLRAIGWSPTAIQVIDLAYGIINVRMSELTGEYFGWSPALTGWLAGLLMFVLARIFQQGAAMREELEGTV